MNRKQLYNIKQLYDMHKEEGGGVREKVGAVGSLLK